MPQAALRFDQRPSQVLTPRLQHAVRLLQLSSLDYAQELQETMAKNPFLEQDDPLPEAAPDAADGWGLTPSPTNGAGAEFDASRESFGEAAGDAGHGAGNDFSDNLAADHNWERDSVMQSASGLRNGAVSGDGQSAAMEMVAADIGLRAHLRGQANLLPLSARDHALVCAVIESLDDDGYLRLALDEIASFADLEPAADAREMSTALKLVQSFEPMGVGARDVGECLRLQLSRIAPGSRALAQRIVDGQLDRLAEHDLAGIAKALACPIGEVETACQAIRRLDPRPGWRFGRADDVHFLAPDVVVRKLRGKWIAQLNPAVVPRLKLNQVYADLFRRHRDAQHVELAGHLQEARWAVRNVEQRFSTILMVAEAILKRQYRFLEYGAFAMKPLGLREIADELGLHESTVCRVTNNKYMATPAGVFELKHFFSRAMPMAGGGACSATAIRGVMHELIAAEDPARPLSDVEIAQRLTRQGLTVARRTVTKYRQLLKVPPVERRRREGASSAATAAAA